MQRERLSVDNGRYERFTEEESPDRAKEAWRIQGQRYLTLGIVAMEALGEDNALLPEIDKLRGPNVRYYERTGENPDSRAVIRILRPPEDGTYRDLPSYQRSEPLLYPEQAKMLEQAAGWFSICEVGAFAGTPGATAPELYKVFRSALHDSMEQNEMWLMTLVPDMYESFVRNIGASNVTVIGDAVPAEAPIQQELTPAVLSPQMFLGNLIRDYSDATDEPARKRLERSLRFFTEGLDTSLMIPHARSLCKKLGAKEVVQWQD